VTTGRTCLLGAIGARPDGGASVVPLNLAIALAQLGRKTTIVDLAGSDLRRMLGLFRKVDGIGEFVDSSRRSLNGLICPAPVPNLQIVGPGRTVKGEGAFAYPPTQKLGLFRALASIESDFVLADLGTALTEHASDFFSMANAGLVVLSADPNEVIRAYGFLKSVLYKTIRRRLGQDSTTATVLAQLDQTPGAARTATVAHVTGLVRHRDPEEADVINEICDTFTPLLIVNGGRSLQDMELGDKLRVICRRYLSIRVEYLGFIYNEGAIDRPQRTQEPVVIARPNSRAAVAVHRIAHKCIGSQTLAQARPDASTLASTAQRTSAPSAGTPQPEAERGMIERLLAGSLRREIGQVERHLANAENHLQNLQPRPGNRTDAGQPSSPTALPSQAPVEERAERILKTAFDPGDLRALEALIDSLDDAYFPDPKWKWKVRALSTPDRVVHHLISRGIRRDFFYRDAPVPRPGRVPTEKVGA
jgi:flagellar biosynthesis protein FlhG